MRIIHLVIFSFCAIFFTQSCEFLDVVPRNNPDYTSVFRSKDGAKKALHGLYSYIPNYDNARGNVEYTTDGLSLPPGYGSTFKSKYLWAGNFSASSLGYDYWSDNAYYGFDLYTGIRYCFSFIKNIDNVPNISKAERNRWKAEADFLIGYYYFLLFKNYGPLPLINKEIPFQSKALPKRANVDSTVVFITKYLDKAISGLPSVYTSDNYGKPTSVAAKAMKAKVLVFAASPLFNGEAPQMFENMTGPDGDHLFPQSPDPSKWNVALDAVNDAIDAAHKIGRKLYYYTGNQPPAFSTWTSEDKAIATNLFKIVDKWNDELIWGDSNANSSTTATWQYASYRTCTSPVRGYNSFEVTIEAVERFYTKDGLPIDVDPHYDYADRYKVKPGDSTAYLNRDRSPRFYATVAYDRGKYYLNGKTLPVHTRNGELQGLINNVNDGGSTGYFLQKYTNPASVLSCDKYSLKPFPFPIIRLAGLYLLDAEAYNEVHGELSGKALDYFNDVRKRAGIPNLQDSWSNVGGVPASKEKLRQIIHRERYNELAYEGKWYYDMRRWVVAEKYMDRPVHGWTVTASSQSGFYKPQSSYENVDRQFNKRWYFLPIPIEVINTNTNLVQNPGY